MSTDFRALCAELTDCLEKADWPLRHRYVFRQWIDIARAALADEPAVPQSKEPASVTRQPSDEELLDLLPQGNESGFWLPKGLPSDWVDGEFIAPPKAIIAFARDVLELWGNPTPQPSADGEVVEVVERLRTVVAAYKSCRNTDHIWSLSGNGVNARLTVTLLTRATELLQRQVLVPVSVSERLPGPEDCAPWPQPSDKSGWCWMSRTVHGFYGSFAIWEQVSVVPTCREVYAHWLPAHALPVPEAGE